MFSFPRVENDTFRSVIEREYASDACQRTHVYDFAFMNLPK